MGLSFLGRFAALSAAGVAAGLAVQPVPAAAQGDLLVAPTRIVLDGRRGTEVILSNIGSQEAIYRISLELRRMTQDGQLMDVSPEEANVLEQAALEMIRYAPRRITLPPGQPQAIRIASRPAADLPDGEYRAHMSFRAIPRPKPVEESGETSNGIKVELIPIYAVSIPIIIRRGNIEAQMALTQATIAQTERGPTLNVVMQREGEASTYGEIKIFTQGEDEPSLHLAGIAVYPELSNRLVSVPLDEEEAALLKGPVRIEYSEMPESGGRLLASLETVLG